MGKKHKHRKFLGTFITNVKSDKTTSRIGIGCVVILIGCIVLCGMHVLNIIDTFKDVYREKVQDNIRMANEEITRNISRKTEMLDASLATLLATDIDNKDSVISALKTMESYGQFDRITYVRESNTMEYFSDGTIKKINYKQHEDMINSNPGVIPVFKDVTNSVEGDISVATPVVINDTQDGYLIGSFDARDQLGDFISGTAANHADSILIDGSGNVICVGNENLIIRKYEDTNFYTDILLMLCENDGEAVVVGENIKMDLFGGSVGNLECNNSKNGKSFVTYEPVPKTRGWTLVFVLFDSTLNQILRPMTIEAMVTIVGLIVLVLLLAALGIHYAGRESKKIYELAYRDELTLAPNENAFKEKARELIDDNPDIAYVVACFDIMNFRYINEGYGHEKADVLLKAVSQAMKECISYNEAYARIGADRFVSLTVDDGRDAERRVFVDDYVKKVSANIILNYPVKFKTGIYWVSNREEDISSMIDKANLARKSIQSDANTIVVEYVDKLMEETRRQEQIESRMEMALANREFVPFLQPKWDMKNDCICGAEALVRWRRLDGSIVPPGDFIPLFEKNGFIEKLDFFMLDAICAYIREMLDEGRKVYPVSINQSRFLMHNPEYVSKVQQILLKYKIPARLVELEITETVFTHDKDHMLQIMNRLKDFNMELSMDDFGSGYSSLNLLRDIPFDVLKIDRGFLDESTQSESGKWILRKIVEMADGLDLRVICEGVETREQVEMLLDVGCNYAQGFLYSRPIPLEEFKEKYNTAE